VVQVVTVDDPGGLGVLVPDRRALRAGRRPVRLDMGLAIGCRIGGAPPSSWEPFPSLRSLRLAARAARRLDPH
jgi:hypothetical protein